MNRRATKPHALRILILGKKLEAQATVVVPHACFAPSLLFLFHMAHFLLDMLYNDLMLNTSKADFIFCFSFVGL
jgi:ABC-type uncharacterized transport system YnjBCD permease subunit